MVAINQKKNLNFGENNSPEISLNSNLKRWFSRNIGSWKSQITYFLEEGQKTYNLCMNINIQALENKSEWESHYKFTWYPDKNYPSQVGVLLKMHAFALFLYIEDFP